MNDSKVCFKCKELKFLNDFSTRKDSKTGIHGFCKLCLSRYKKEYYIKNQKHLKILLKKYIEKNKGALYLKYKIYAIKNKEKIALYQKNYAIKNREKLTQYSNKYAKNRSEHDCMFKLGLRLRHRLYVSLRRKSWKKDTEFSQYIGCSLKELLLHIEKQFISGMSWDKHGQGKGFFHIDHIKPLITATTKEELYALCHYSNLQPLWSEINESKGGKLYYNNDYDTGGRKDLQLTGQ